jgi:hypothetical protein
MRVDHCRSHVFMAEKLLHRSDVITVGQKMRGPAQCGINSGMAERRDTSPLRQPCFADRFSDSLLDDRLLCSAV